MIHNTVGILIALYSFFDFKKALTLYFPFSVFAVFWAYLFEVSRFTITLGMVMPALFFLSFFLNKNCRKNLITTTLYPYSIIVIFEAASMFFTCFTSVSGFTSEFTRLVSNCLQSYVMIIIAWYTFETEEDFNEVIKTLVISFLIAAIYAFFELYFKENIYFRYKAALSTQKMHQYLNSSRGYRIVSIFNHSIGAGLNMGLFVSLILVSISNHKQIPIEKTALTVAILCIPCILLTRIRSTFLFVCLACIPFINFKSQKFRKMLPLLGILVLAMIPLIIQNKNLFLSLFDENVQKIVKGSTFKVRIEQFAAVAEIMKQSPYTGLGEKFLQVIQNQYTKAALGFESIWLEQMAEHGIVGLIVQLFSMFFCIIAVSFKYHSTEIFFLTLAYWATYTITSLIGFNYNLYWFILFYYIKSTETYKVERMRKLTHYLA